MTNTPRTIKVGIIGCGRVTETFHLPSLRSLRSVRVIALSDTYKGRLERLAGLYNIEARYTDPDGLINSNEIEAVAVCAPSEHHYALGMSVLGAGKHLFMEKPGALRLEESAELLMKAGSSVLKSAAGFNLRSHRNVRKAKNTIGSGALGTIKSIRSVMSVNDPAIADWRKKRALGGGSILDLGIHHFDLMRFLSDAEAEEVRASSVSGEIEDETAHVTMKFSNGILTSSLFSYGSGDENEIEIFGSKGILKISLYDVAGLELSPCGVPSGRLAAVIGKALGGIEQTALNAACLRHGGIFRESYLREWESFIDSVINDTRAVCSLEDGRRALAIALAAALSADTDSPVKLSDAR